MFLFQQQPANSGTAFDVDLIWNSLYGLLNSVMDRLPYLIFAFIIFIVFLVIARIVSGGINAAGRRTRLDLTLADLLARLSSF